MVRVSRVAFYHASCLQERVPEDGLKLRLLCEVRDRVTRLVVQQATLRQLLRLHFRQVVAEHARVHQAMAPAALGHGLPAQEGPTTGVR